LLDIGNEKNESFENSQFIKLPKNFCNIVNSNALIESVFLNIRDNYSSHQWFCERAILAAKNVYIDEINFTIQEKLAGELISFKSINTVTNENEIINYSTESLNLLDLPGFPPHNIRFKIGSPIILFWNMNAPKFCNGTKLVIKKIMENVTEATILNGKFKRDNVLLPRIPMIFTDASIQFKRLQFSIPLEFVMIINKSQGQTMVICRLDLEHPCFSYRQLYVVC